MVIAAFTRLLGALGLGAQPRNELEEKIDQTIVKLDLLEDRVAELRYRFEKRSRELFDRVVSLLRRGERSRATIYAGELSQIRSILKMIIAVQNLIIMTKERLKTVRDMRELNKVLMVFGAALEGVKDQAASIYPNINMAFDEISRSVRSLIVETSVQAVADIDPAVITNDAMEVLKEAMKKAEEKLREDFPEPPVEPVIPARTAQPQAAAAPAAPPAPRPAAPTAKAAQPRIPIEQLEQLVLDYIRRHNGYLDIRDFTARYGVTRSEVLHALHRLAEKGLIALA